MSVREHVDQLCILDTGSADGTVEIAKRYADTVVSAPWEDHFGRARQASFGLCDTDWILHLDADDQLMCGGELRALVAGTGPEIGAYLLNYVTSQDKDGNPTFSYWRERLVRAGAYRWVGRIHEVLEPVVPLQYRRYHDAWVLHRGHGDGMGSLERNIRMLRLAHEEDPNNPRTLFYLGRDLVQVGQYDEAIAILERYIPLSTWADEAYIAQMLIGHVHRTRGEYARAYHTDLDMLKIHAQWPHAYFALAEDCYYLKRWADSVHFCEIGERLPLPETNLFLAPEAIRTGWMIFKVVSLHQLGRTMDAADLTDRAVAMLPDDAMHKGNQAFFRAHLDGLQLGAYVPASLGV